MKRPFSKNRLHARAASKVDEPRKRLGGRLPFGVNPFHAHLAQAVVPAEVPESGMPHDEVAPLCALDRRAKARCRTGKRGFKGLRVRRKIACMRRIGLRKGRRDALCFMARARGRKPDMRVERAVRMAGASNPAAYPREKCRKGRAGFGKE